MKQHALHDGGLKPDVHPHKPKHLAERFQAYITAAVVVAAGALLVMLVYGVMNTGTGTPAWMH